MKFTAGLIVGILSTLLVLFIISKNIQAPIQYIPITGRNGDVEVHTRMGKDSVLILVGKPDEVTLHTIRNAPYETWRYNSISNLSISFINGELVGISDY